MQSSTIKWKIDASTRVPVANCKDVGCGSDTRVSIYVYVSEASLTDCSGQVQL
jgi:hypothetical protein